MIFYRRNMTRLCKVYELIVTRNGWHVKSYWKPYIVISAVDRLHFILHFRLSLTTAFQQCVSWHWPWATPTMTIYKMCHLLEILNAIHTKKCNYPYGADASTHCKKVNCSADVFTQILKINKIHPLVTWNVWLVKNYKHPKILCAGPFSCESTV